VADESYQRLHWSDVRKELGSLLNTARHGVARRAWRGGRAGLVAMTN
jgi:hypothetical protein